MSKAKKTSRATTSGSPELHYNQGVSLMDDGLFEAAILEFKEALERNPRHKEAFYMLTFALARAGKADQAIEMLKGRIADNPRDKEAHDMLAVVYVSAGMAGNAIEEYKIAIGIDPEDVRTRIDLGFTYLKEGCYDDAEREFKKVLKRRPGDLFTLACIKAIRKLKSASEAMRKPATERRAGKFPPEVEAKVDDLERMTREFCDKYLDDEYRWLAEKLIEKMTSEKDVSFLRGRPEIWAAGVIYALGQINNLFLKGASPRATPDDICGHFNVKRMTVVQKAAKIREMYGMRHFDDEFSRNPLWELIYSRSS